MHIERRPLAVIAAETIKQGICDGVWSGSLPGEIRLSRELGISRSTLRKSLEILSAEGILISRKGRQTRINLTASEGALGKKSDTVNILAPFPLERMPNYVVFWIDDLRSQLHEKGLALSVNAGKIYYRQQTTEALETLVAQRPTGCWILAFSKGPIQRWFQESRIPTVIAGIPEVGIHLPSIAVDHEAVIFHAVGRLTSRGHRRIFTVAPKVSSPGLDAFKQSFSQTCERMGSQKIAGEIIELQHDDPESIGRAFVRALKRANPPTAFILLNPFHAVTAFSYLPKRGYRIPEDVSIITTYGDRHLEYLTPRPSHYHFNVPVYTRKLFETVSMILNGMNLKNRNIRIMPDPVKGNSIAAPKGE